MAGLTANGPDKGRDSSGIFCSRVVFTFQLLHLPGGGQSVLDAEVERYFYILQHVWDGPGTDPEAFWGEASLPAILGTSKHPQLCCSPFSCSVINTVLLLTLESLFPDRTDFQEPLSNSDRKIIFFSLSRRHLPSIKQWSEAANSSDFSTAEIKAIRSHPVGKIVLGFSREYRSMNGEISASGQVSLRKGLSGGCVLGTLHGVWRWQVSGGGGEGRRDSRGLWTWLLMDEGYLHIFLSVLGVAPL